MNRKYEQEEKRGQRRKRILQSNRLVCWFQPAHPADSRHRMDKNSPLSYGTAAPWVSHLPYKVIGTKTKKLGTTRKYRQPKSRDNEGNKSYKVIGTKTEKLGTNRKHELRNKMKNKGTKSYPGYEPKLKSWGQVQNMNSPKTQTMKETVLTQDMNRN